MALMSSASTLMNVLKRFTSATASPNVTTLLGTTHVNVLTDTSHSGKSVSILTNVPSLMYINASKSATIPLEAFTVNVEKALLFRRTTKPVAISTNAS